MEEIYNKTRRQQNQALIVLDPEILMNGLYVRTMGVFRMTLNNEMFINMWDQRRLQTLKWHKKIWKKNRN